MYSVEIQTDAQYKYLASEEYRADIQAVPGEGSVLGVYYFGGNVYAFRNKSGSGVGMYKSSSSGWTEVSLGYEVTFTAGTGTAPAEGDTITKGSTTAVLKRLVIESGSFGAGTAAGRLIFNTITNGPFTAGAFSSGISATCGTQTTVTIPNKSGRFQFITTNFYGQLNQARMYGCDGKNKAFEFDGTTFVRINTGAATDTPSFIAEHRRHLMLGIGSSIMHSAIGDPLNWQTTLGAGEIAVSDTVTGLLSQPGSESSAALVILCRNSSHMLYGSSSTDWQVTKLNDSTGAYAYTAQVIGDTFALDDRGLVALSQTNKYGNFILSALSQGVLPWLRHINKIPVDSHVSREKMQYRVFFADKYAAYWTITPKSVSMTPMYLNHDVTCSHSTENTSGQEVIFFGSSDGFVYQMEKGTSFDGDYIEAYFDMVFNHSRSYRGLKKYRRITFDIAGTGYAEFSSTYDLSYGHFDKAVADVTTTELILSRAYWDEMVWDEFIWDGSPLTGISMSTPGDGENIAIRVMSYGKIFAPIRFSGALLEFSPLRMLR